MATRLAAWCFVAGTFASAGCMGDVGDGSDLADDAADDPAEDIEGLADVGSGLVGPVATLMGNRFVVFYQASGAVVDAYADPVTGLPEAPGHLYVFAQSHATAYASSTFAVRIHSARRDFLYAPAFDLNQFPDWRTASEATLASYARDFREAALFAGADLFAFNEAYTDTGENPAARVQIMKILRYLAEPDATGRSLRGVFFLTEQAATASRWTSPAAAFWTRVDDTCDAVVAEHYHGLGFVCDNPPDWLSHHYFAMREWLNTSGDVAKVRIANSKYTVLHSARYGPGPTGWAGADSNVVTLARFQRMLSRAAWITRTTPGGFNRISFAPVTESLTAAGVHPRITGLVRWHYSEPWGGDAGELGCIDDYAGNCACD